MNDLIAQYTASIPKIVILIIVAAVAAFMILRSSDNPHVSRRLQQLEDTTAQLRVRATVITTGTDPSPATLDATFTIPTGSSRI